MNLARQSAAGFTGRLSILLRPPCDFSSCMTSTQQITRLAGIMNQVMPMKPWMKKLFSGAMSTAVVSKLMRTFTAQVSHMTATGAASMSRILLRRSLRSSHK